MIPFNVPPFVGNEIDYIKEALNEHKISGDGRFTHLCSNWFKERLTSSRILLTTSCTHALEMSAILADIQPGDEVIMPSYTFVSTANAFVLRGAKIVFVDIRKDTMNIDERLIEQAITDKTKAIVVVHYAGVACEMDYINMIAKKYNLMVIEDAAQGVMAEYKGKHLGSLGTFGCYSFHETKNYSMGEGGAIVINDTSFFERAEIIREKGTNRSKFFRGQIDKYTWVDLGSSFLPSDINAAYLYGQLIAAEQINASRLHVWNTYNHKLKELEDDKKIELPFIPKECKHNAHMYYIKVKDIKERTALIEFLKQRGIMSVFHYIPLHSAPAGLVFGRFCGEDRNTTKESERLLRLPMYYGLKIEQVDYITSCIKEFYRKEAKYA